MDLRKQIKTALALAAALAALTIAYIAFNASQNDGGDARTPLGETYGIAPAQVERAELRYADPSLPDIALERSGGAWRLTAPVQALARNEPVERLLRFLERPVRKRVGEGLEPFGLDAPTAVVQLSAANETRAFLFGRKSVSYGVYVKEADDPDAFVMEASILDEILASPNDLRDRRIVPLRSGQIARLRAERPDAPPIAVEREDAAADWRLAFSAEADAGAVERFLETLLALNAERFLPPAENASEPVRSVWIETFGGETRALHIESPPADGAMRIRDERGYRYETAADLWNLIPDEPFDWRGKRIADFQRTETARIQIENRYGAFALERAADDLSEWSVTAAGGGERRPADPQRMSDLLFQLDSAAATRILAEDSSKDGGDYGFDAPRARLRFMLFEERGETVVEIGDPVEGGYAVRSSRSPAAGALRAEDLNGWLEGPAAFRAKRLLDERTPSTRRIERRIGPEEAVLTREGFAAWRIEKPAAEAADTRAVERLQQAARELRAERFYSAPPPDAQSGLRNPRLILALQFQDGSRWTFRFGKSGPDGVYAQMEGDADVFAVSPAALESLSAPLDQLRAPK